MPRRSAAAMAISPITDPAPLPTPPAELTPAEGERWLGFVISKPQDHFDVPALALLTQLVKHLSMLTRLNAMVDASEGRDIEEFDRLLKMRIRETAAVKALSVALRLPPSSRYDPQRAQVLFQRGGRIPYGAKPWEEDANPFQHNGRKPKS